MDPFNNTTSSNKKPKQGQANPFARALAETEKRSYGQQNPNADNLLTEAMAQAGPNSFLNENFNLNGQNLDPNTLRPPAEMQKLQQQQEKELKRRQLREKLHHKVNPVEQTEVFNARQKKVEEEIDQIRKELKELAVEINEFYKEVDITLQKRTPEPGQTGVYYTNFFEKLKAFIILLRQKIRSARTWAKQMQQRKKKKKVKYRGLNFTVNETKAAHDMLHHERSNAYSGA